MIPQVIVNWTYALTDHTGFLLQRCSDLSGVWGDLATPTSESLQYVDTDVSLGETRSYQIAATNQYGTGSFSNSGSVYITLGGPLIVFLTTTANNDIKPFDGTVSSSAMPIVTPDITVYGDSHDLTQSFDNQFVGIDKTLSITGGSIISASGNTYIPVATNTNTGSITGPSTGSIDTSRYVLIPPNTDLPYDPGWFVSINDATSGSNGLLMIDQLPVEGTNMVLTSSNGTNWAGVGTASIRSNTLLYANGRYVGLNVPGNASDAQYSDDGGVTWVPTTIPTSEFIWDGLYDGANFVACGNNGTIVTSSNGADWGLSSTGVSDQAFRIIYNAGRYVVVGPVSPGGFPSTSTGTIYTSTDLITWQAVSSSVPTTNAYLGVAYSPALGMYLAVGEAGQMASSTDGVHWTDRSNTAPMYNTSLSSVAWNASGSYFVACDFEGYIYNSPDGLNWTLNTINPHIQYQGNYYTYVVRIDYDSSINKFLVFGTAPV